MKGHRYIIQGEPSFTNFSDMRLTDNNGFYQFFLGTYGEVYVPLGIQIGYSPNGDVDVSHINDVL